MLKMILTLLATTFLLVISTAALAESKGADNIVLQAPKRGDVAFAHALHQKTLGDCMVCHELFPKAAGAIERLQVDGSVKKKAIMKQCRACHRTLKKAGDKSGPTSCSGCHKR